MVDVLRGGGVETRRVELGEQNQRFVEVLAGVAEGERVMLVEEPAPGNAPPARMEPAGALDALARRPL